MRGLTLCERRETCISHLLGHAQLDNNVEYIEREDEFDQVPEASKAKKATTAAEDPLVGRPSCLP